MSRDLSNLKPPWKPGESGFKGKRTGRAKGNVNTATIIKRFLNANIKKHVDPKTNEVRIFTTRELIILRQIKKALNGNLQSADWIFNRAGEAMPSSTNNGEGDLGNRNILIQINGFPINDLKDGNINDKDIIQISEGRIDGREES